MLVGVAPPALARQLLMSSTTVATWKLLLAITLVFHGGGLAGRFWRLAHHSGGTALRKRKPPTPAAVPPKSSPVPPEQSAVPPTWWAVPLFPRRYRQSVGRYRLFVRRYRGSFRRYRLFAGRYRGSFRRYRLFVRRYRWRVRRVGLSANNRAIWD
jgi:hypothetical protein